MTPALETAKCCGSCVWTNKKKRPQPEDHAPHYTVAKTERWCEKLNIPTVREAVCTNFELETKRGGAAAVKRIWPKALLAPRKPRQFDTYLAAAEFIKNPA